MIELNYKEDAIFKLLKAVVKERAPETTLRVAGGWVRDKILGLESHDIDIAVDNMSGLEFATHCYEHWKGWLIDHKPTKLAANTEANKNLESAIIKIKDVDIDFTQLRREFYDDDSRNPEIETEGVTPEEDARRRDLTINALFYNIHTGEVEDYVGGLSDMEMGRAMTPTDPLRTFLDDPLRVLRIIRFTARFELRVSPEVITAAKNERVQHALRHKISRERMWSEFSKFMSGPRVDYAAAFIDTFGLRDILLVPTNDELLKAGEDKYKWSSGFGDWDMNQNNPNHTYGVWRHTIAALSWLVENIKSERTPEDTLIRNVALLLHDVGKCDVCSQQVHPEGGWATYHDHETSSAIAADEILKNLKAPNDIRERVVKLIQNHMRLHLLPKKAKTGLRRVLRKVGTDDFQSLVEMSKADSMGKDGKTLDTKYDSFDEYIGSFIESIDGASEVKPPINGNKIMEVLSLKPGRSVGIVLAALKEQLIEYPGMNEPEAIDFIKQVEF